MMTRPATNDNKTNWCHRQTEIKKHLSTEVCLFTVTQAIVQLELSA